MKAAAYINTTNYKYGLFWPSEGHKRDWDYSSKLGIWIQKNEKTLNKKPMDEAVKLVVEEFPTLVEIDVRDYANRGARWEK